MLKSIPIRSAQDLGQAIALARRARNMSQRDVAKKFGFSQPWVSAVERGRQMARLGQVIRLARGLGLELHAALTNDQSPQTSGYPDIDQVVD